MQISRRSLLRSGAGISAALAAGASAQSPALSQQGTPPAGVGSNVMVNDSLMSMLDIVPAQAAADALEQGVEIAIFADVAQRLNELGVEPPPREAAADDARDWIAATTPLTMISTLAPNAFADNFRDLTGWHFFDIDQSLEAGSVPGRYIVLKGRFSQEDLESAWIANGYESVEIGDMPAFSLAPTPEIDFASDLGRMSLGKLNNVMMVDDNTLVYTAFLEQLEQVAATIHGDESSLASISEFAAIIEPITRPLSSAALFAGAAVAWTPELTRIATAENGADDQAAAMESAMLAAAEMPHIEFLLAGYASGSSTNDLFADDPQPTGAVAVYSFLVDSDTAAVPAAKTVHRRLATGASTVADLLWRDMFPSWVVTVPNAGNVILLEIDLGADEALWFDLVVRRDAGFLAW